MASAVSPSRRSILVACNVYLSAGTSAHVEILSSLLAESQKKCRVLRETNNSSEDRDVFNKVAVVHAFADGPYDRSSIHLAGCSDMVSRVASELSTSAMLALSRHERDIISENDKGHKAEVFDAGGDNTTHPNVGIVDHVSVMPLLLPTIKNVSPAIREFDRHQEKEQIAAAGWSARQVGLAMSKLGCTVHFYGAASEDNASLASVRRERTNFFQSGGLSSSSPTLNGRASSRDGQNSPLASGETGDRRLHPYGISCVGSPPNFVENFNIRLSSGGRRAALSLCRAIRQRDGGLPGVEGLTLPHGENKFEVACNLLLPHVGSRDAIRKDAKLWLSEYNSKNNSDYVEIDKMYGVGMTQRQCLEVLCMTNDRIDEHDSYVATKFRSYFRE